MSSIDTFDTFDTFHGEVPIGRMCVAHGHPPTATQVLGRSFAQGGLPILARSYVWTVAGLPLAYYCVFLALWATAFTNLWLQRQDALKHEWGTVVSDLPCNVRREGGSSLVIGGPSLVTMSY